MLELRSPLSRTPAQGFGTAMYLSVGCRDIFATVLYTKIPAQAWVGRVLNRRFCTLTLLAAFPRCLCACWAFLMAKVKAMRLAWVMGR